MMKLFEPAIKKRVEEVTVYCNNQSKLRDLNEKVELDNIIEYIVGLSYRSGFKDGMYANIKMK